MFLLPPILLLLSKVWHIGSGQSRITKVELPWRTRIILTLRGAHKQGDYSKISVSTSLSTSSCMYKYKILLPFLYFINHRKTKQKNMSHKVSLKFPQIIVHMLPQATAAYANSLKQLQALNYNFPTVNTVY